jgi:hypothetical protein
MWLYISVAMMQNEFKGAIEKESAISVARDFPRACHLQIVRQAGLALFMQLPLFVRLGYLRSLCSYRPVLAPYNNCDVHSGVS